jgi:hypothetical protein
MEALMTFIQRVTRNANPLTGLVTATIGLLMAFSIVTLTNTQIGVLLTFVGALVLFLSAYITPVSDPRLEPGTLVNQTSNTMPNSIVVTEAELEALKANV